VFRKSFSFPTYLKYFFSYMILLSVLILGFFYIIKNQFVNIYLESAYAMAEQQSSNFSKQLDDHIINLSVIDNTIYYDSDFHENNYRTDSFHRLKMNSELKEYVSCSGLITSIIYLNKSDNSLLSTTHKVTYNDGIFSLYMDAPNYKQVILDFDPSSYYNEYNGQLINLSYDGGQCLIYFPAQNDKADYVFFYTLDINFIFDSLKNMINNEIIAAIILDPKGHEIIGYNSSMFSGYLDSALTEGVFPVEDTSLCVFNGINNEYSLVTLLSDKYINEEVKKTALSAYLFLAALGLLGLLVVIAMMQITYRPLYKLTHKILGDHTHSKDHFQVLDKVFTDSEYQAEKLTEKLNNYRIFYQKSLLNSQINLSPSSGIIHDYNLDDFFDGSPDREFFLLKLQEISQGTFHISRITEYFDQKLPSNCQAILLEEHTDHAFFLLNYKSLEDDKKEMINRLIVRLFEELNLIITISTGTNSPLNIPELYESIIDVCKNRPVDPIVECPAISTVSLNRYKYPKDILDQLNCNYLDHNFASAKKNIALLFEKLEYFKSEDNSLSEFSIRCILIDMLSIIVSHMTREHVSFRIYNDRYFEILYLCRNFPYQEKSAEITFKINELADLYEQKVLDKLIESETLTDYLNLHFCDPDLSLAVVADHFHVSLNHMSYLFKQELNMNFSDYLWKLRLEKAKHLLSTTNKTIDDISIEVGYLNPPSFRRKFRKETGISPSQFRETNSLLNDV